MNLTERQEETIREVMEEYLADDLIERIMEDIEARLVLDHVRGECYDAE